MCDVTRGMKPREYAIMMAIVNISNIKNKDSYQYEFLPTPRAELLQRTIVTVMTSGWLQKAKGDSDLLLKILIEASVHKIVL